MTNSRWRPDLRFRLGLDGNPIRRPSDRREAVAVALTIIFVLSALPAALLLAMLTWQLRATTHEHQYASWHQVHATVAAVAVPSGWMVPAETVTWRDSTGRSHRGIAGPNLDASVGDRVTIWVDAAGQPTGPPVSSAQVVADSLGVGVATEFSAVLIALAGYGLVRCRLDARRYRDWDAGWQQLNRISR